jgi:hypothetical protein
MPKVGRPKLPKDQARSVFPLRLSGLEQREVRSAANHAKEKPVPWARNQLLKAARSGTFKTGKH